MADLDMKAKIKYYRKNKLDPKKISEEEIEKFEILK